MATKTITVTQDAFNFIHSLKREQESFSHLFIRLAKEKSVGEKYFGVLAGDVSDARERLRKVRKELDQDFKAVRGLKLNVRE